MAFAHDLLEQAWHLAGRDPTKPRQVNLRRAVSNAYYSVFHLLSSAAAANWKPGRQRHDFARILQHGHMKQACETIKRKNDQSTTSHSALREIAIAFNGLQDLRHTADYDSSKTWSKTEVVEAIETANKAITLWPTIADKPIAQDFLLSLLARDRR